MQTRTQPGRFSTNTRRFLEWFAVLALVAYGLQITALDHWPDHSPAEAYTASHAAHCHGAASGCSDSSDFPGTLAPVALSAIPPVFVLGNLPQHSAAPANPFLDAPRQPPRAA